MLPHILSLSGPHCDYCESAKAKEKGYKFNYEVISTKSVGVSISKPHGQEQSKNEHGCSATL